MVMLPIILGDP